MRCQPLAIPHPDSRERPVTVSRQSPRITHADPRYAYGCAIHTLTLAGLSMDAETPPQDAVEHVAPSAPDELTAALGPIARGESPETVKTSGYVVHSLQPALHDGLCCDSAEEAVVTAVTRGGDTDTIGAIAGAVAGARSGGSGLRSGGYLCSTKQPNLTRRPSAFLIEEFGCIFAGDRSERPTERCRWRTSAVVVFPTLIGTD
jgi:ADP-ribosyl-[dinitrogen reductase] hydrolase